nr:ThuA domain-containing protein [Spirosoma pollinicola]
MKEVKETRNEAKVEQALAAITGAATTPSPDKNHPSTAHLPDHWERTDEWYNYRSLYSDLTVVANLALRLTSFYNAFC